MLNDADFDSNLMVAMLDDDNPRHQAARDMLSARDRMFLAGGAVVFVIFDAVLIGAVLYFVSL